MPARSEKMSARLMLMLIREKVKTQLMSARAHGDTAITLRSQARAAGKIQALEEIQVAMRSIERELDW